MVNVSVIITTVSPSQSSYNVVTRAHNIPHHHHEPPEDGGAEAEQQDFVETGTGGKM